MSLPIEAWQEDSLEPSPKDLPLGSDPQAAHRGITEEPESVQVIESISETLIPFTIKGAHHLGQGHQVSHSNSV